MAKNFLDIYNEKLTGKYSDLFISIINNIEAKTVNLEENVPLYTVYSVIPYRYDYYTNEEWEEIIREFNKGWIVENLEGDSACTAIMTFINYLWYDTNLDAVIVHVAPAWYWNFQIEISKSISQDDKDLN